MRIAARVRPCAPATQSPAARTPEADGRTGKPSSSFHDGDQDDEQHQGEEQGAEGGLPATLTDGDHESAPWASSSALTGGAAAGNRSRMAPITSRRFGRVSCSFRVTVRMVFPCQTGASRAGSKKSMQSVPSVGDGRRLLA